MLVKNFFVQLWFILIAGGMLASCSSSKLAANKKITKEDAQSDIYLLKQILEKKHPGLYWYSSKSAMDSAFDNAISSVPDTVTEAQLKNIIAVAVAKIRCGHTAVRFSAAYNRYLQENRYPQFPLSIKTWGDTLVVMGNYNVKDSNIKRGTVITAINGMPTRQLLDSLFEIISTDGYSDNFKSQVVSFNFPMWYRNRFGVSDKYEVSYIDVYGVSRKDSVPAYKPVKDTSRHVVSLPPDKPSAKERKRLNLLNKRSLKIDTASSTAFMNIATFSSGHLRTFFRRSFRELKEKNIQHLIIDLRQNGGGRIASSNLLAKYIKSQPFKIADTIAAVDKSLHYNSFMKPKFLYWLAMVFTAKKKDDDKYHFTYLENNTYKPKTGNHFKGNVYIIQGGFTFSASTMFIQQVSNEPNVTLIGEETGGGAYGNNAIHLPQVVLPNSKIRVVLPLYRVVFSKDAAKNGRGIMPDIYVPPTAKAIRENKDLKLVVLETLIGKPLRF